MEKIINENLYNGKVDWDMLSNEEQVTIDNMVKIVGVLYSMCKVQFVKKINAEKNKINHFDIKKATTDAESLLQNVA